MNLKRKILIIAFALTAFSCAEKEFDPADPAKSYQIAREPYDDQDWEKAVTKLGEYKARFPYSQFAIEAELLIANAQFELQHYAEAAAAYDQFVKLHPKHPKVDYAMFRVGESYWQDAPPEPDREQEYTQKSIDEWQKLVERLPQSEYTPKAKKLINEGRLRMASSDEFISKFYCKREIYHACAYRSIKMVREYEEFPELRKQAFERAGLAMKKVAEAKAVDPKSDANLFFRDYTVAQLESFAADLKNEKIPDQLKILKK